MDANAIGDGSALAPVGLQEGGNQTIINQTPPVTPNPPPEEEACNQATIGFVALYDVTLDADLGGVVVAGDELCLSGAGSNHDRPLGGPQTAFDVTHPSSSPFNVVVVEPIEGVCGGTPPFVPATVTSGNPTITGIPLTQVCIRGA